MSDVKTIKIAKLIEFHQEIQTNAKSAVKAQIKDLTCIDSLVDNSCKDQAQNQVLDLDTYQPSEFKITDADRFIPIRSNNELFDSEQIFDTKMLIETEPPENLFEEGKSDQVTQNNQQNN